MVGSLEIPNDPSGALNPENVTGTVPFVAASRNKTIVYFTKKTIHYIMYYHD